MSAINSKGPTPYHDVNNLLYALLERVKVVLQEKLVGLYLYGSLSSGDFDPASSDVDFLFVTTEELSEHELVGLRDVHIAIAASGSPYAKRLEGSYIPREALRRYDPDTAHHPTIGIDWEFHVGQHGHNWIIERHIVREQGIVVSGPSPELLIDPVSAQDLRDAVCELVRNGWRVLLAEPEEPEWLRPRAYQAFAILTLCRALYTLHHGIVVTKVKAADWALQALDSRWQPIIKRALLWREQYEKDAMTDMMDFLRYAIKKCMDVCEKCK